MKNHWLKIVSGIFLIMVIINPVFSEESYPPEGWITDINKAITIAEDEDKRILMNFTGSDWCGWCIRLKDEVFISDSFRDYAEDNLVLLFLDFPGGIPLSKGQQRQNQLIAQNLGIRGYPTIMVFEADLTPRLQTGYIGASPDEYVEHLESEVNISPSQAQTMKRALDRIIPSMPAL